MEIVPSPQQPRQSAPPQSPEEADRQARIAYLQSIAPPPKPKPAWPKWLAAGVVALALLGGAAYWFMFKPDQSANKTSTTSSQNTATKQEQTPKPLVTKHYDSPSLMLGFDYPEDWKVSEADAKLTLRSSTLQLKNASGQKLQAQVVVTIQPKQTTLKEFGKGNAVAVLESEKISYTKPSQLQRAQTYISFLHYAGSSGSGIDGIYITGDLGYQKDQAVPMIDVVRVDPLVMATFVQCPNAACSGSLTPLTLQTSEWNTQPNLALSIKKVLTTLSIQ